MMILSIFLSVAVFAQCTPVESIWNPLLIDQKVCYLSLTVVAFIDCGKYRNAFEKYRHASNYHTSIRRGNGLCFGRLPLDCSSRTEDEAQGTHFHLCFSQSWSLVSRHEMQCPQDQQLTM